MTYNVRYFGHATRGVASTALSLSRIAHAIARQDPPLDLVLLQEIEASSLRSTWLHWRRRPDETQLDRLLGALSLALRSAGRRDHYEGYYFPAHDYRLAPGVSIYTTGLAILVRSPLRVVRHHEPHDITHRKLRPGPSLAPPSHAVGPPAAAPSPEGPTSGPKPWLKQTRICAHLVVEHQGDTLDVFNTHLSLPSFLEPNFWRRPERMGHGPNQLEEARKLCAFLDSQRTSDRFLVAGDFNALPGSPVYRLLTAERGLHDPLLAYTGDLTSLKRFSTAGFMQLRMHLDHLLSGPGLRWVNLDGSHPFDHEQSPFRGLSDHTPLIGTFTW